MIERHREIRRRRHLKEKRRKLRTKLTAAKEQERAHLEAKLLKSYPHWISPADVLPKKARKKGE